MSFPRWSSLLSALRRPISEEKRTLLTERWRELPSELRTANQVVGRQLTHCGYTLGPSYCSFGCTHCYLPTNANRVPLPSLDEMKVQIDANRRLLGYAGALQITGGDVIDAYVRAERVDELIEICRYSDEVGVVPMVMTHGQRLLEDPSLLERMVREGRLRKLSVHIDITQAGRPGFPIRELRNEADLHPLRQQFVDLIHQVRQTTGKPLHVAQTVTVTERNVDSLGEILTWLVEDRARLSALGMISFQPEADVGRTRFSGRPVTPEGTWEAICQALHRDLITDSFAFGDPACSHMMTVAVLYPERRVVPLFTADTASREFVQQLLDTFGGMGSRGARQAEAILRRLSLLVRRPAVIGSTWRHGRELLRRERLGVFDALRRVFGRRVGFLNIVQHNFMSRELLEKPSPEVERRLAACSFRGAVRRGEAWDAVPMCAMNIEERESLYQLQIPARVKPKTEDAAYMQVGGTT